ncbi:hypothetical protein M406DRAFT_71397 [Cryphonectria parasitica EP155]|uniref:RRM domain-containing protein n=1 Tax=Cryphonectria parasitica (strain ATCC 38755 / EP155) TaxID=660469 RepID=A0A9P4Y8G8_CRYP1|nr:uncharacterized protein M406DRAFT_71397 [Cryphonectria parasitica EP155]KAF3768344.1 hypothetical protein M406DRAFT_71397 [Cryphonectria parasitica EP155]
MVASDHEMLKDMALPGNQTGVYYIPISNLPFNTSWQQIKDFVRQGCEVDHVEFFRKSTSGWVRLKGRHLNGTEFNGRAIIAEGKNANSPILVRGLEACKSKAASSGRLDGRNYCTMFAAPEKPGQVSAPILAYAGSILDATQRYNPGTLYAAHEPYSKYGSQAVAMQNSQMAAMDTSKTPERGVIYTEQRGIQIRNLSSRATESQTREAVLNLIGSEASFISEIRIPLSREGKPRGLAFVHFQTAELAKRMVMLLNGFVFRGRKLQVEGETIYSSAEHHHGPSPLASAAAATAAVGAPRKVRQHYYPNPHRDEWKETVNSQKTSTSTSIILQ